jgi:hypothetical protein
MPEALVDGEYAIAPYPLVEHAHSLTEHDGGAAGGVGVVGWEGLAPQDTDHATTSVIAICERRRGQVLPPTFILITCA